jgi:hypothetical protein
MRKRRGKEEKGFILGVEEEWQGIGGIVWCS